MKKITTKDRHIKSLGKLVKTLLKNANFIESNVLDQDTLNSLKKIGANKCDIIATFDIPSNIIENNLNYFKSHIADLISCQKLNTNIIEHYWDEICDKKLIQNVIFTQPLCNDFVKKHIKHFEKYIDDVIVYNYLYHTNIDEQIIIDNKSKISDYTFRALSGSKLSDNMIRQLIDRLDLKILLDNIHINPSIKEYIKVFL